MEYNKYISENFGISEEVVRLVRDAEKDLEKQFKKIDETAEFNQLKVMKGVGGAFCSDNGLCGGRFGTRYAG